MTYCEIRHVRLFINGQEVEGVTDFQVSTDQVEVTTVSDSAPRYMPGETRVEVQTVPSNMDLSARWIPAYRRQPESECNYGETGRCTCPQPNHPEPPQPTLRDYHHFAQDPEFHPARICEVCDMWPEHHNHGQISRCVCNDCMPRAEHLPEGYFCADDRANWRPPNE